MPYKNYQIVSAMKKSDVTPDWQYRDGQTIIQFNEDWQVTEFLKAIPEPQLHWYRIYENSACDCCEAQDRGLHECSSPNSEEICFGDEWMESV